MGVQRLDLWFATTGSPALAVDSRRACATRSRMLTALVVLLRFIGLIARGHRAVALENLALRQQLAAWTRSGTRPPLRTRDRLFWVELAHAWRDWRTALIVVQPQTVVRWHRQWLRRQWTRSARARPGRPRTDAAIRTLVSQMAAANALWGAPRIHGELLKLGLEVSERTISRLLRRPRRPPSQTWRTFLTNHVTTLVCIDFFTVPTLTGRVLFVLLLLAHHRRRIVHVNITEHPTAAWTAQQMIEAFPDDTAPRWLLRDRDAVYGDVFRRRVAGMGTSEVLSSPSSPWQNPYAERLIGSIRRECLDHVVVLGERHLRCVLAGYLAYYHESRTHLGLEKDTPPSQTGPTSVRRKDCRHPRSRRSSSPVRAARRIDQSSLRGRRIAITRANGHHPRGSNVV
jgi:putative transposase